MTQNQIKDLVLIHGWGFDSRVWKNFIPYLNDMWRVRCIDLPGYGAREKLSSANIDLIVRDIEDDIPEGAIIFAWSLGGTVAMKLAQKRDDFKALVLIASSPCFLNRDDWQHGVEFDDFDKLASQLSKNKTKTLQTFAGVVAMGEEHPRQIINKLSEQLLTNVPAQDTLTSGLEILRNEDLRQSLAKQHCPTGIIFGEKDILVKRSTGNAMQASRPDILTIEIPETGHAPFLSRPRETAEALMKLTANLS